VADKIVDELSRARPELTVRRRELIANAVPHISNDTIAGFYTPESDRTQTMKEATKLSDELIEELKGAEALVISSPIFNFGVPSALKAWIDQIVRINETFSFDGEAFTGLVPIENAYLALAYGASGYTEGGPFSAMNFLEPYLVSLMGFLGVRSTKVFTLEGTTGDPEVLERALNELRAKISAAVSK
jgi:FMN-dependent NADH-azoreductase